MTTWEEFEQEIESNTETKDFVKLKNIIDSFDSSGFDDDEYFRNFPIRVIVCYAACKGYLDVLEWVKSQTLPLPWDEITCRTAATHGQLDVLKWIVANGYPWHPYAFSDAGHNGHLHIVQWILHMKLPWDVESMIDYTILFNRDHSYTGYNSYLWYTKYSNKARWAEAIDINLTECLYCMDLEQLIKTYI